MLQLLDDSYSGTDVVASRVGELVHQKICLDGREARPRDEAWVDSVEDFGRAECWCEEGNREGEETHCGHLRHGEGHHGVGVKVLSEVLEDG